MRCGDTAQWGAVEEGSEGERIYNDFSFFALGESAPWELTPLTPLAKKRGGHIQISFSLSASRRALSHLRATAWRPSLHNVAGVDARLVCSPLSFFDLLLEGGCFFFMVWAWLCSLHRRSWKLINFHIMKAWVRQMAARTVTLQRKAQSNILISSSVDFDSAWQILYGKFDSVYSIH